MIAVVGTRGFPDVPGGVERHCEELYTRLAARGFELVVFTRSPYMTTVPRWSTWRGIRLRKVYAPRRKSSEAIWHSMAALLLARAYGARVVHIHAIGPGLTVPLARLLGLRVVFTHHGRDYMRGKWGPLAKWALRAGERMAVRYADRVFAVSREVEEWVSTQFGRTAIYAPNGIAVGPRTETQVEETLASFQLVPRTYAVTVARLVPEKGVHDLIRAVEEAEEITTLVVVGDADHRSSYASELRARAPAKVRFVGARLHDVTLDLLRGARVFVLPSFHEGLPIALLEALACGTPVVASDIAPNREIVTDRKYGWLIPPGDVVALRKAIGEAWALQEAQREAIKEQAAMMIDQRFSWQQTVDRIVAAYKELEA